MTSDETIEMAARVLFLSDRGVTLPAGFAERQWDEGHAVKDDYIRRARALAESGLLSLAPPCEEAYQRGHEDGYWNGKTTDMSPAQAAAFMAPYRSRCPGCVESADGKGGEDQ